MKPSSLTEEMPKAQKLGEVTKVHVRSVIDCSHVVYNNDGDELELLGNVANWLTLHRRQSLKPM